MPHTSRVYSKVAAMTIVAGLSPLDCSWLHKLCDLTDRTDEFAEVFAVAGGAIERLKARIQ